MPFRSKQTLDAWIEEFQQFGYSLAVKVIPQDGSSGRDTGLVGITMMNAQTVTYIEPDVPGGNKWRITFEPRETELRLDAGGALRLSTELAMVSALCAFLETKSNAFFGDDLSEESDAVSAH
ncbi:hypothetical protein [Microbacterium imperiale]|uniref:Uncharacterized protein n=1 Tax=Microbacterium imperiale TaxID=33884 RepID=A0A9W6HI90_9MICO|nr:hypothetical protein [Microbacterium imperiale]MBP2421725.1 hypothetical protein [Microbacterium imperiale]MDS0199173.1 hypothetical protein [Microbacterium imperiale]BFE42067.1 hypothetical protein GCM10017544_30230 [Microbacterium imperiale]GLJ81020.1 hypothetical protein GCM10017586_27030 [Microbacterium imperiale]